MSKKIIENCERKNWEPKFKYFIFLFTIQGNSPAQEFFPPTIFGLRQTLLTPHWSERDGNIQWCYAEILSGSQECLYKFATEIDLR